MSPQVANPSDVDAERQLLGLCLGENRGREEVTTQALATLSPAHFAHPHHASIFAALTAAVKDSGDGTPDWVDVRDRIDAASQARSTLTQLVASTSLNGARSPERLMTKLDDAWRGRQVMMLLEEVKPKALAMRTDEAYEALLDGVFALGRDRFATGAKHVSEFIPGFLEELEHRRESRGMVGLRTRVSVFDKVFYGLQKQRMYVLGGLSGTYKTATSNQVTYNVAKEGNRVLVQSPEMGGERLIARWACEIAGVKPDEWNGGTYDDAAEYRIRDAVALIKARNIIIDPNGHQSVQDIRKNVIRFRPDLLVVDYLGLIDPAKRQYNEYRDMTEACRDINAMKNDFDIAILLLSQLNRQVEQRQDKHPVMSDLRNTGRIEHDADGIVLTYYPKKYATPVPDGLGTEWRMYDEKGERYEVVDPRLLEFIVPKNRDGDAKNVAAFLKKNSMWTEEV